MKDNNKKIVINPEHFDDIINFAKGKRISASYSEGFLLSDGSWMKFIPHRVAGDADELSWVIYDNSAFITDIYFEEDAHSDDDCGYYVNNVSMKFVDDNGNLISDVLDTLISPFESKDTSTSTLSVVLVDGAGNELLNEAIFSSRT